MLVIMLIRQEFCDPLNSSGLKKIEIRQSKMGCNSRCLQLRITVKSIEVSTSVKSLLVREPGLECLKDSSNASRNLLFYPVISSETGKRSSQTRSHLLRK